MTAIQTLKKIWKKIGNTIYYKGNIGVTSSFGNELAPSLSTPNWTLGAGWSYLTSPDRLEKISTGYGQVTIAGATNIEAGKTYKVEIVVDAIGAIDFYYKLGNTPSQFISTTGTHTEYITTLNTDKFITSTYISAAYTTIISSISIKEVISGTGDIQFGGDLLIGNAIVPNDGVILASKKLNKNNSLTIKILDPNYPATHIKIGVVNYLNSASIPAIWFNQDFLGVSNYAFSSSTSGTVFNTPSGKQILFRIANSDKMVLTSSGNFGIATSLAKSKFEINGSFSKSIHTFTTNTTLTIAHSTALVDGTSNTVTITLPTAVGITGRIYNIKCINNDYQIDVATNGTEEIDGDATNFILRLHEAITIQSDGANWWII